MTVRDVELLTVKGVVATVGSYIVSALGGADDLLQLLICLIIADLVTGFLKGVVNKNLSSAIMFKGLLKKSLIFVVITVAVKFDEALATFIKEPLQFCGVDIYIRLLFISYFILEELLSLLENLGELGVPLPKWLVGILAQVEGTLSGTTTPTFIADFLRDKFGIDADKLQDKKPVEQHQPDEGVSDFEDFKDENDLDDFS